jgi:hypothetical protein
LVAKLDRFFVAQHDQTRFNTALSIQSLAK